MHRQVFFCCHREVVSVVLLQQSLLRTAPDLCLPLPQRFCCVGFPCAAASSVAARTSICIWLAFVHGSLIARDFDPSGKYIAVIPGLVCAFHNHDELLLLPLLLATMMLATTRTFTGTSIAISTSIAIATVATIFVYYCNFRFCCLDSHTAPATPTMRLGVFHQGVGNAYTLCQTSIALYFGAAPSCGVALRAETAQQPQIADIIFQLAFDPVPSFRETYVSLTSFFTA